MSTDKSTKDTSFNNLPEPEIKPSRKVSTIWIIPIAAALIGIWLVFLSMSEKGPEITIIFETAEGLEAGKTPIKYKDVIIGKIDNISLNKEMGKVIAHASTTNGTEDYLNENTRIWVVRPRLGLKGVSGLGTLVSGSYLEIDPGTSGDFTDEFIGLETPPTLKTNTPGKEFTLTASKLGSFNQGSPIIYKGFEVGEILGYALSEDKQSVRVDIFVHAPHDKLVQENSTFWNMSGLEVTADASGFKINTGSLQSLLIGGIAFETPINLEEKEPAPNKFGFTLFNNKEDVLSASYSSKRNFILYFTGSIRGLSVGAPVELKGIKIGTVKDIKLEFDAETLIFRTPVLIEVEPGRLSEIGKRKQSPEEIFKTLFQKGLRAQLKTGSFLTGQLFVDIGFHPETKPVYVKANKQYQEIPTIPSSLDELTTSVSQLIEKLQRLPLDTVSEKLVSSLDGLDHIINSPEAMNMLKTLSNAATGIDKLVAGMDKELLPKAISALNEAEQALAQTNKVLAEDSPLRYDLQTTLQELSAAARSIRLLADYLERNPSALLYGKGGPGGQN